MKQLLSNGLILFLPFLSLAHDGEHVTTAWYQNYTAIVWLVLLTLLFLGYGIVKKRKNYIVIPAFVLAIITVFGLSRITTSQIADTSILTATDFGAGQAVTLYKSPNCGCCSGHAAALEKAGFTVTIEETHDLAEVKRSHNIPSEGESCHTSIIDTYVVEGHVPLEAIEKLITEKPDVAGIGLSGMPIGTPGMPGNKTAPYEIYQLSDAGTMSPYLTI